MGRMNENLQNVVLQAISKNERLESQWKLLSEKSVFSSKMDYENYLAKLVSAGLVEKKEIIIPTKNGKKIYQVAYRVSKR